MSDTPKKPIPARPAYRSDLAHRALLTTVEQVHYTMPGENPLSVTHRSSVFLTSQEQPYSRKVPLKPEWEPLDTGWITEPGILLLENKGGITGPLNPTAAEKAVERSRIVEICCRPEVTLQRVPPPPRKGPPRTMHDEPLPEEEDTIEEKLRYPVDILLLPGESLRLRPTDIAQWRVRCLTAGAQVYLTLLPR